MAVAKQLIVALGLGVVLSGCAHRAPQPLYYWGSYQDQVYGHLKGDTGNEEQIAALEGDAEHAAATGLALPPGFLAHLGLLYGETGHPDKMAASFEAEKQRFPESSSFFDFLLKKQKP
jgi:hypothetical protein